MGWAAKVGLYEFTPAAIETSTTSFAEFGRKRNGFFFQ